MQETINQISDMSAALPAKGFYSEGSVQKTRLIHSAPLSALTGCEIYLKCENEQNTGSFKLRGATSAILNLSDEDKAKGVLTASSGNHGAATSLAASKAGVKVRIYVPEDVSPMKEEKIRSMGADIVKVPGSSSDAEIAAAKAAEEEGLTFISPYNHIDILAGQSTVGGEIFDSLPEVDVVAASIGGGGLISGTMARLQSLKPDVEALGCWPANSPAMLECIKAGTVIDVPETDTISDGTAGGVEPGAITLPLCSELLARTTTLSEQEIMDAMKLILDHHDMRVEGAAGVALAGVIKEAAHYKGKKVVVILCGANIVPEKFDTAIKAASTS